MSWAKKVRHPSDLLKPGDRVDAVVLAIKPEERRISLGLKQALADPWQEVPARFPIGSQIQGKVTKLMNFGAFVELAEGIEGLVHVSEISAEKRINHPQDILRAGQSVRAVVLAIDVEKRQIKLSMKQAVPTSIDEYIAEHKAGDRVSGRVVSISSSVIQVELGEGIFGTCGAAAAPAAPKPGSSAPAAKADLSSLTTMLQARWKGNTPAAQSTPETLAEGQIRTFKIKKLDAESKKIEVELA
jgi:small subunit ribosomal protein S1